MASQLASADARCAIKGVARALGLASNQARKVLQASRRANRQLHRFGRNLAPARPHLPVLNWPAAAAFDEALAASDRPFLLATLHMGNYLASLLALAPLLPSLGRVTALRRIAAPALENRLQALFTERGLQIRMIHTGRHPARTALQALRRGEHVLLLYDVPPSFDLGRCHEVTWLGQPGRLAAGPAMLARAGNAWLWPFALTPAASGQTVLMQSADPVLVRNRSAEHHATCQLAGLAGDWIQQAPEAWLLWDYLGDFWQAGPVTRRD